MRRLLTILAVSGLLALSACDFLERDGKDRSDAEQAVLSVRDVVPPGTLRTGLDLVLAGLAIYATRKGQVTAKKADETEAREYNLDEGESMARVLVKLGYIPPKA